MRGAQRFAKAALDAAVDDGLGGRHRFEVLQVGLRIVVQNDAGIEQGVRIEQLLDAAHQVSGLFAPLLFHKGRHVAPRAMLGFE